MGSGITKRTIPLTPFITQVFHSCQDQLFSNSTSQNMSNPAAFTDAWLCGEMCILQMILF